MNKYKIRVNYKSGKTEEFWAKEFAYEVGASGPTVTWTSVGVSNPIYFGLDEVESIWQVDYESYGGGLEETESK